jgi:hypothetical protein
MTSFLGCGGESNRELAQVAQNGRPLTHNGVSIDVPSGWDGRILFLDAKGSEAIFQVANFELPPNDGFEPPRPVAGQQDSIKSMAGEDTLIAVNTDLENAAPRSLPVRIGEDSFLAPDTPEIPRGHALARESGCFDTTCLKITVDFALAPPSAELVDRANDVLASLSVPAGG